MSMLIPGFDAPVPLVKMSAYTQAVRHAVKAFHPYAPAVFLAEHVHEVDASVAMLVIDIASADAADVQTGPGLDMVVNLDLIVGTDRGKADAGAYDLQDMVEATIALASENRWGLGGAVDPCKFVGWSRDAIGSNTNNWYAARVSFRQGVRLPVPADLGDSMAMIIDTSRIFEVWLGFDPDIGQAHLADYVLVAEVPPDAYDNAAGGSP